MNDDNINIKDEDQLFLSRGCGCTPDPKAEENNVFKHRCCKLDEYDWLKDISLPSSAPVFDCVEVRFKNSRKDFYRITDNTELKVGEIVAVEASPGHDIGIVSLVGETARLQMKRKQIDSDSAEIKKLYRHARTYDIEKWINSVEKESATMLKTRKIASELNLGMKVNDVEYQGDSTKAIFYYTAEERVDFRELIKRLAEAFKIRIEMKQIGVRQEAARLGGIGSCGRELCCATWMTNFKSVTTSSAKAQQLSLNPQKLAGQCSKLKCCLNYEYDNYVEALSEFPDQDLILKTLKGNAIHQKADIFSKQLWYAYIDSPNIFIALSLDNVKQIIKMNKNNKKPKNLEDFSEVIEEKNDFGNTLELDDLNRFDKKRKPSNKSRKKSFK
jgi:cell fate regulator YaaT (PSP1 superfamily)